MIKKNLAKKNLLIKKRKEKKIEPNGFKMRTYMSMKETKRKPQKK